MTLLVVCLLVFVYHFLERESDAIHTSLPLINIIIIIVVIMGRL